MVTLFLSPSCTSCRKARAWLTNHEVAFDEHNIITSPLTHDELMKILSYTENGTEDIISTRSKVFQKLNIDVDDLTIKDAVLIIKKLYNEGEMAVMITPETATAYTDALAAAATKLPIEFFQLLPIGASKKVRQTVQASLRSAAAEEDGDEDEHSHIMKFGKPYTYKGEKYTEVDLSGVANLTGMNVRQAENRMEEEDIRAAEKTLNYYYCCLIASMATGKDVAFFLGLPLAEAVQLRAGVNHKDFFA